MQNDRNIGKIYSRKRFLLRPSIYFRIIGKKRPNIQKTMMSGGDDIGAGWPEGTVDAVGTVVAGSARNKGRRKKWKIIKVFVLCVLISLMFRLFCYYFEPIFKTLCEEKIKSIATIITNQQSTIMMNKYQYEQLYTVEKDENQDVVVVRANVVPINNLISDLTENIQHEFDDLHSEKIELPFGSLTGIYFLAGMGPKLPINVSVAGTVDTNIKSEFVAQGINQTLHRVYVEFECDMKIVTPMKNFSQVVKNQVIIAEHVIVGNIPSSYYEFDCTVGTGS